MENFGLYLSKSYDQLLIGFTHEGKLHGKVLFDKFGSFYVGYRYHNWRRYEYLYVGTYLTYQTLSGYLSFLKDADYDHIMGYFRAKEILLNGDEIKRKYEEFNMSLMTTNLDDLDSL